MKVWLKINIRIKIDYLEYMFLKEKNEKLHVRFTSVLATFLPCNFIKLSLSAWLYIVF